jgi:hypothetical protein
VLKFITPHYLAYITTSLGSWLEFYRAAFIPRPKFVLLLFWTRSRVAQSRVGFDYREGQQMYILTLAPRSVCDPPSPQLLCTGYGGRVMKLISHLYVVPRWMCGAVPSFFHVVSWHSRGKCYVLLNLFCELWLLKCVFLWCILFVQMLYDIHRHTHCDILYYEVYVHQLAAVACVWVAGRRIPLPQPACPLCVSRFGTYVAMENFLYQSLPREANS